MCCIVTPNYGTHSARHHVCFGVFQSASSTSSCWSSGSSFVVVGMYWSSELLASRLFRFKELSHLSEVDKLRVHDRFFFVTLNVFQPASIRSSSSSSRLSFAGSIWIPAVFKHKRNRSELPMLPPPFEKCRRMFATVRLDYQWQPPPITGTPWGAYPSYTTSW